MLVGHVFVTEGVNSREIRLHALSRSFAAASSHVRGTVKPRITLQELCQGGVSQFAQNPHPTLIFVGAASPFVSLHIEELREEPQLARRP